MGLSDRQLPQAEKRSRGPSPGLELPRQTRAEGAWKDKELLSSFESPAGRGLQPPPPAWRDQSEGLSGISGASVPGGPLQERPGERVELDMVVPCGCPGEGACLESCGPAPGPRARLGEQGTPTERLLGMDIRGAGAGVGSHCSPEPAIAFGKPPWRRRLAGVRRAEGGRRAALGWRCVGGPVSQWLS